MHDNDNLVLRILDFSKLENLSALAFIFQEDTNKYSQNLNCKFI